MKEKRKKEEGTSSETPSGKKPSGSGRLSGMIESMQKRGSPLNAHRVATRYFDSFRRERNIPAEAAEDAPPADEPSEVDIASDAAAITAVDSAVKKKERKRPSPAAPGARLVDLKDLDDSFTPSESKVYRAIYGRSVEKKAPALRLGLKELRELTGLSDKTVRVAVHSLEKKLALKVVESSLGIYGRKLRVLSPEEVLRERLEVGVEIDPTTKRVIAGAGPVSTTVNTGINTALNTAVITAVDKEEAVPEGSIGKVSSLYEFYTGNKWGEEDEEYFERVRLLDAGIIETALILISLEGKGGISGFSDLEGVLEDLGTELREGYLEHLRGVWKTLNARGKGG
jgi:hypothetical protein